MQRLPAPALPDWLARMLPFERYVVEVGDGAGGAVKVHVCEAGELRGRAVVMLHGNPSWSFLWRKVARSKALAGAGLRLVMPDLVGLGLSEKPRDPGWHTIDRHGVVMAGLLERLGVEGAVFVVQDWGGAIGLRAVVERPALLAGLVLLNTVVGPPKAGFKPTAFHRLAATPVVSDLVFRALDVPQRFMRLAQGDRGSIRGEVARGYRWPLRRRADRAAPLALARMVPDSLEHWSIPALERCQAAALAFAAGGAPIEIVWGDRDPVLGRVRTHLERLFPRARVTRTQAGHYLQEEVPEAIGEAIRRVAESLAASRASA